MNFSKKIVLFINLIALFSVYGMEQEDNNCSSSDGNKNEMPITVITNDEIIITTQLKKIADFKTLYNINNSYENQDAIPLQAVTSETFDILIDIADYLKSYSHPLASYKWLRRFNIKTLITLFDAADYLDNKQLGTALMAVIKKKLTNPALLHDYDTMVWILKNGNESFYANLYENSFFDSLFLFISKPSEIVGITLAAHGKSINATAYSPNNKLIASCADDGAIKIWDTQTSRCLKIFDGHLGKVKCVDFSPDGNFLASGSYDNTIKLWDLNAGDCRCTINGHHNHVTAVAFSTDGTVLISCSDDKTIKFWDIATNKCIHTIDQDNKIACIACSSDGKRIASTCFDSTITLVDTVNYTIRTLYGHTNWITGLVFSPDGSKIASGSTDSTVKLWNSSTGKCLGTLGNHCARRVKCVAFSPDGKLLASGFSDKINLWDMRTGNLIRTLSKHQDLIRHIVFSPDSKQLASGSDDACVRLWETSNGDCIHTFKNHTGCITYLAFSSDGKQLASGSDDTTINLWNLVDKKKIALLLSTISFKHLLLLNWCFNASRYQMDFNYTAHPYLEKMYKCFPAEIHRIIKSFSGNSWPQKIWSCIGYMIAESNNVIF